jgi:hypothetical protein
MRLIHAVRPLLPTKLPFRGNVRLHKACMVARSIEIASMSDPANRKFIWPSASGRIRRSAALLCRQARPCRSSVVSTAPCLVPSFDDADFV